MHNVKIVHSGFYSRSDFSLSKWSKCLGHYLKGGQKIWCKELAIAKIMVHLIYFVIQNYMYHLNIRSCWQAYVSGSMYSPFYIHALVEGKTYPFNNLPFVLILVSCYLLPHNIRVYFFYPLWKVLLTYFARNN